LGEDVGAAVVLRSAATAEANELRAFVGKRLAHFKVPRRKNLRPGRAPTDAARLPEVPAFAMSRDEPSLASDP
jgi:hypothetical protein